MKNRIVLLGMIFLVIVSCNPQEKSDENTATSKSDFVYPEMLHPLVVDFLKKSPPRNYDTLDFSEMRKGFKRYETLVFGEAQAGANITNDTITTVEANIPVRIYRPANISNTKLPALIYYHGGAWCFGGLNMVDHFGSSIAQMASVVVISVDYRLAPEYPYPAGVNDAYAALIWVNENSQKLGIDNDRIVISGGSAGGNLAAVVALKARDENGPKLLGQILLYPATDLYDMNSESYKKYGHRFGLEKALMDKTVKAYVPKKEDRKDVYVSPLLENDLSDLPQAFVITAGFDPLRDEGEAYAHKLANASIPMQLSRYDSMVHGFAEFAKIYPNQSNAAYQEMADVLKKWCF